MSTEDNQRQGARFRRYFLGPGVQPSLDDDGFVIAGAGSRSETLTLQDLLEKRVVVLVGHPFTGKSRVLMAAQMLFSQTPNTRVFKRDYRAIDIDGALNELREFDLWLKTDGDFVWLVDSIDECAATGQEFLPTLHSRLSSIPSTRRNNLRLILSCRQNDLPGELEELLRDTLGSCFVARIAPLDRVEAKAIAGNELDRVCNITRTSGLNELVAQPRVLECLAKRQEFTKPVGRDVIWRAVLEEYLEPITKRVALADAFHAACRIAFFLTFGDRQEVGRGENSVFSSPPTLGQLFAGDLQRWLPAAQQAVRTGLFEVSPNGYRLGHRHIGEWLTAFQLKRLVLERGPGQTLELLSDGEGELAYEHLQLASALRDALSPDLAQNRAVLQWIDNGFARHSVPFIEDLFRAAKNAPAPL